MGREDGTVHKGKNWEGRKRDRKRKNTTVTATLLLGSSLVEQDITEKMKRVM